MQLGRGRKPCESGAQFGSRYTGDPVAQPVTDYLPDEQLRNLENIADFRGMLVFDKWTCNTTGRQAIFQRTAGGQNYRALMIDQGFTSMPANGIFRIHPCAESIWDRWSTRT
jgi:hypothetical protein